MRLHTDVGNSDWIGEEENPAVRGIPVSPWDTGEPRKQRSFERILKQDRQIKAVPSQHTREHPFP